MVDAKYIAERHFTGGVDGEQVVLLRIGAIYQHADQLWRCPITIGTDKDEITVEARGVDSLQALVLALGTAKLAVSTADKTMRGLRWLGGTDLGLYFEVHIPAEYRRFAPENF